MTEHEIKTTNTDCEKETKNVNYDYCTNPVTAFEETTKFSWLDDFGWI